MADDEKEKGEWSETTPEPQFLDEGANAEERANDPASWIDGTRAGEAPEAEAGPKKRSTTQELVATFRRTPRLTWSPLRKAATWGWERLRAALGGLGPLKHRWRSLTLAVRGSIIGAAALVVLLGSVLMCVSGDSVVYVKSTTFLRAGPDESTYEKVGRLEVREPLVVLDQAGKWFLVRDSIGRVGYAMAYALSEERPPVLPTESFTRCSQRASEQDDASCKQRAQEQLSACRAFCEASPEARGCPTGCDKRAEDCLAGCGSIESLDSDEAKKAGSKEVESQPPAEPSAEPAAALDNNEANADEAVQKAEPAKRKKAKRRRPKRRTRRRRR